MKNTPFGSGQRYGEAERREVAAVFDHGSLIYWSKFKVKEFCEKATAYFGRRYCAGGSSGSAALHAAIGALEIPPGYEVITSPITDMGSLIGILYQNLIPVFADVDPRTYNITADSIRRVMTDRTRAIMAVHLAGNPCEMDEIMKLAAERNIPVIEDCAQAYDALYRGRKVGAIGDIGCFSLNESKHISCGDGGFALTDSEHYYNLIHNYLDKYYDRLGKGNRLEHVAPCYRLSELQYAVAIAQLGKLENIISARRKLAAILQRELAGVPGLWLPEVKPGNQSSWWFYMFRLDGSVLDCDGPAFAAALNAEKIPAMAGYIPRPIYREKLFAEKSFFPGNIWPAEVVSGRKYEYPAGLCPVAEEVLHTAIRLPVNEFFTENDMLETATEIRRIAQRFAK